MKNPIIPFYKQLDTLIVEACDCNLYDSQGKQYIDFESGDWAANLGHSHPKINEAIKKQVDIAIHDGLRFRNEASEQLAISLTEKMGMTGGKAAFVNSGSEAVNLGITLAKKLTGRKKIVKIEGSFLASYGHGQISSDNTLLLNVKSDDFDSMERIDLKEIAAFVFEPGSAHGLVRFPSNEFIEKVASAVKKSGGLLMANEVTTGMGRTGKWFGFQHYNYNPDIISVGKGLGNGYPVSGVIINETTSELFDQASFRYAQSHQNDPLGCSVGLAVISTFEEEDIINQSFEKGRYFLNGLIQLQRDFPDHVIDSRGRGLMLAVEFNSNSLAESLYLRLIDNGYLVGQKESVLRFMPPLVIDKKQIDQLFEALRDLLINK